TFRCHAIPTLQMVCYSSKTSRISLTYQKSNFFGPSGDGAPTRRKPCANSGDPLGDSKWRFEPGHAELADVTDPNIVHGTMAKLDAAGIYQESEVEGLVADYLANKGNNALTKWVTSARDRFRDRERDANDHGDKLALDELQLFRKDVGTF